MLFRGTFATQRAGGAAANAGDLYIKNSSNTNVSYFAGRLWSLFEAGQPYRLNPRTLETEVRRQRRNTRQDSATAHARCRAAVAWSLGRGPPCKQPALGVFASINL